MGEALWHYHAASEQWGKLYDITMQQVDNGDKLNTT